MTQQPVPSPWFQEQLAKADADKRALSGCPVCGPALGATEPESVVPTEAMCDRARGFIMGLDLKPRNWGMMQLHLDAGGYPTLPRIREKAKKEPFGHITKWDVAECIYLLMTGGADDRGLG